MEWLLLGVLLLFGLTVLRGAPYVPTHKKAIELALDRLSLQAGDVVVDLGSGDGAFLKEAAKRGLIAYGYEINPLLCVLSWLRCLAYRQSVHILWRDFWFTDLPQGTKGVFIFAGGPFMSRLAKKLEAQAQQQAFTVVSYGFELPHKKLHKAKNGLYSYIFDKNK